MMSNSFLIGPWTPNLLSQTQEEGTFCVTGKDTHEKSNHGALVLGFYSSGHVCSHSCSIYGTALHHLEHTGAQVNISVHSVIILLHKDL